MSRILLNADSNVVGAAGNVVSPPNGRQFLVETATGVAVMVGALDTPNFKAGVQQDGHRHRGLRLTDQLARNREYSGDMF